MNSDSSSSVDLITGIVAVGFAAVVGLTGLASYFGPKQTPQADVPPRYWYDGLPVEVGDQFLHNPVYGNDRQVYVVMRVDPKAVVLLGRDGLTTRVWGSDYFSPGGIARGLNQGTWARVASRSS